MTGSAEDLGGRPRLSPIWLESPKIEGNDPSISTLFTPDTEKDDIMRLPQKAFRQRRLTSK